MDIRTNTVTYNHLKVITLGYNPLEVPSPTTYQFFTEKSHPDDEKFVMYAMCAHLDGKNQFIKWSIQFV